MNRLCLLIALAAAALAAPAAWGKTQIFLETGEAEFSQGHAEGIVWTSLGTLRLGRAVENLLGPTEGVEYAARLAEGPDGAVFAVTGGTGRIYRIKDGKAALWATLADKFLFSCAADKAGNLYAGTGGTKGRVWRISPQPQGDPKAEVFFEADDVRYVWDLAWLKDGALAAATGDKGKVFRIAPDGKSEVILDSEADHVLCLATAPDGTLYAGTDGPSVVYRWDGKKAFILYDADEAEVTALALDAAGNLFVAASGAAGGRAGGAETPADSGIKITLPAAPSSVPRLDSSKEGAPAAPPKEGAAPGAAREETRRANSEAAARPPRPDKPAPPAGGQAVPQEPAPAVPREPAPAESPPPSPAATVTPSLAEAISAARSSAAGRPTAAARAAGASVYRIAPDGVVARVFEGRDAMILALAVADGRLVVGTGKSARIYETGCRMDEEETCVASVDPKQVMSLLVTRDGRVMAGSAGPGRVYALSGGFAKEGTYTSQVYDAGGSARWGAIDWRATVPDGTDVRLATRTGNVRDPEKGMWSDWSKDVARPAAKIQSPAARFIQFRVTMRGRGDSSTPVLQEFQAAYQRANEAPRVTAVTERATQDQAARAQAME
ncbi:MAG: WD40 repeat domain-containing protein, partial [Planctomycetes bacterium]|nr:WD40 repeat domain-containing protein [Planctomycetota bacterium]